jgi:hypothetical protein
MINMVRFRKTTAYLAMSLAMCGLLVGAVYPGHADARSAGCGAAGAAAYQICETINVQLNPKPPTPATVTVTREAQNLGDNKFTLENGWITIDGNGQPNLTNTNDTGKYTSENTIAGSNTNSGSTCQTDPSGQAKNNRFDIQVTGSATGSITHVRACGGGIELVNINVNVTGGPGNANGGIKGTFAGRDPGASGATGATLACSPSISTATIAGPTNIAPNLTTNGVLDTGLILKPGTYSVNVNCITGDLNNPPTATTVLTFSNVVVKAGQTTDLGNQTCSALGSGCPFTCTPTGCTGPSSPGSGGGATPPPSNDVCDNNPSFSVIDWFICGIVHSMASVVKGIDSTIGAILKIDTNTIFNNNGNSSAGNSYFKAWQAFRNIAYALIVILGLVMVVSQVMDLGVFSASTVRQMGPALFAAVILIAASWNLENLFYSICNDAYDAIQAIIFEPFKSVPIIGGAGQTAELAFLAGGLLTGTGLAIGAVALGIVGLAGIGLLLLGAVASLFSAWILIEIRDIIAGFLIVAAPIPIALSAFKPTRKATDFWLGLSGTIGLTIPAVGGVLAMSQVAARLSFKDQPVVSFVELVGGFALVWGIFKRMDKVAGQVGDVASRATSKVTKAASNARRNNTKRRLGAWKQGGLLDESTARGRLSTRIGRAVGASTASGKFKAGTLLPTAGGRAARATYDAAVIGETLEHNKQLKELQNDDSANAVLFGTGGVDSDAALNRAADDLGLTGDVRAAAITKARAVGINRATAMAAGRTVMQNKARAFTPGNVRALDQFTRRLSGNSSETYTRLANDLAFYARSSGRGDLGGTDWIDYDQRGEAWTAARAAATAAGRPGDQNTMWQVITDRTAMDGAGRLGVSAVLAGHDNGAVQMAQSAARILTESTGTDDASNRARIDAAKLLKEFQGSRIAAGGSLMNKLNQVLYGETVDATGRPTGNLHLNPNGNVAAQLVDQVNAPVTAAGGSNIITPEGLTTLGRAYPEYDAAEEARRRAMGGGTGTP